MSTLVNAAGPIWLVPPIGSDAELLDQAVADGERVVVVARAYLLRGTLTVRKRILAVTSSRIISIARSIDSPDLIDVPYDAIRNVAVRGGIGPAELIVRTGHGQLRFQLGKEAAFAMKLAISQQSPRPRSARLPHRAPVAALPADSGGAEIEHLRNVVERLETDIARLQQQVDFLEQLMRSRSV